MLRLLFFSFVFLISCNQSQEKSKPSVDTIDIKTNKQEIQKIFPDYIDLQDKDFNTYKNSKNRNWFICGKDKLFLIPYTDYSISTLILTNVEIKDTFFNQLLKDEKIVQNDIKSGIKIDKIKTDKGLSLGVSLYDAEKIFGKPYQQNIINDEVKCLWKFKMLDNREDYKWGNLKPFVFDDLEFVVELHFINDKLVTLIYSYEVV